MATLEHLGEIVSEQLRTRVDGLLSAVEDDTQDFSDIASLADGVREFAAMIAEIYGDLEQTLARGLLGDHESGHHGGAQSQESERKPRQQASKRSDAMDDEKRTKEELLEEARELNIHGRSSMTREELALAVEAEESVTKEELLERAREAEIEGRSSMAKGELRDALRGAGGS